MMNLKSSLLDVYYVFKNEQNNICITNIILYSKLSNYFVKECSKDNYNINCFF